MGKYSEKLKKLNILKNKHADKAIKFVKDSALSNPMIKKVVNITEECRRLDKNWKKIEKNSSQFSKEQIKENLDDYEKLLHQLSLDDNGKLNMKKYNLVKNELDKRRKNYL